MRQLTDNIIDTQRREIAEMEQLLEDIRQHPASAPRWAAPPYPRPIAMTASPVQTIKLAIVSFTSLEKDALHVYVGLIVFFATALLARRRLRDWLPLAAAVSVALLGEGVDMADDLRWLGHWQWQASLHDVLNTSFWPLAIFLLARWSPLVSGGPRRG